MRFARRFGVRAQLADCFASLLQEMPGWLELFGTLDPADGLYKISSGDNSLITSIRTFCSTLDLVESSLTFTSLQSRLGTFCSPRVSLEGPRLTSLLSSQYLRWCPSRLPHWRPSWSSLRFVFFLPALSRELQN